MAQVARGGRRTIPKGRPGDGGQHHGLLPLEGVATSMGARPMTPVNMYSRFIEGGSETRFISPDRGHQRPGKRGRPLPASTGPGPGAAPGAHPSAPPGSVGRWMAALPPGALGAIPEDWRELFLPSETEDEPEVLEETGAGLWDGDDSGGGYLEPLAMPPMGPNDLRLLELVRRAQLGSATDSGVFLFPGDDESVSDVSDGSWPGYRPAEAGPAPGPSPGPGSGPDFSVGRLWRHRPGVHGQRGFADVLVDNNNVNQLSPRTPNYHVTGRKWRPDSLAINGHEYEELPASRYQTRYPYADMEDNGSHSDSGGGMPLPVPMLNELKTPINTGSSDNLVRPLSNTSSKSGLSNEQSSKEHRRRENPLYDESGKDDLQPKAGTGSVCCCPCSGLVLVGAVACIALILALLLFGTSKSQKGEVIVLNPEMAALVERMEARYTDLAKKYDLLEAALNLTQLGNGSLTSQMEHYARVEQKQKESITELYSTIHSVQSKLDQLNSSVSHKLSSLKNSSMASSARIASIEGDFSQKLSQLGATLTGKINDIRNTPGPKGDRGPPGAGNTSLCGYLSKQSGSPALDDVTRTTWYPDNQKDITMWMTMGLECSTENGETSVLEVERNPVVPAGYRFRCVCRGALISNNSRYCRLNIWRCPLTS